MFVDIPFLDDIIQGKNDNTKKQPLDDCVDRLHYYVTAYIVNGMQGNKVSFNSLFSKITNNVIHFMFSVSSLFWLVQNNTLVIQSIVLFLRMQTWVPFFFAFQLLCFMMPNFFWVWVQSYLCKCSNILSCIYWLHRKSGDLFRVIIIQSNNKNKRMFLIYLSPTCSCFSSLYIHQIAILKQHRWLQLYEVVRHFRLTVVTVFSVLLFIGSIMSRTQREYSILSLLKDKDDELAVKDKSNIALKFVHGFLGADGVLLTRFISSKAGTMTCQDVLLKVFSRYCREKGVSMNDSWAVPSDGSYSGSYYINGEAA
uniref:Innexin n=1 Tax=Heterorhabditis bacteriophora TaxID=37862 RepID=A0A1I7WYK5_HETBA